MLVQGNSEAPNTDFYLCGSVIEGNDSPLSDIQSSEKHGSGTLRHEQWLHPTGTTNYQARLPQVDN